MSTVLKPRPLPEAPSKSAEGGREEEVTLYDLDTLVVRWQASRRTLQDYLDLGYIPGVRFGRRWKVKAEDVNRIDNEGLEGGSARLDVAQQRRKKMS